ncbi:UNVERIFIED_CONTAM: hypothetical protein FKN15_050531 [Acipenser sinensis]
MLISASPVSHISDMVVCRQVFKCLKQLKERSAEAVDMGMNPARMLSQVPGTILPKPAVDKHQNDFF